MTTPATNAGDGVFYFAYGSNMSTARLVQRIPVAVKLCNARLEGYRLQFHKIGQDGSGKCDVVQTSAADAVVHGVLYEIDSAALKALDIFEGAGRGYRRLTVGVLRDNAGPIAAETYVATAIDPTLRPFCWYREHVLRGARESGLPAHYVSFIESVDCCPDPDRARHARELAIYGAEYASARARGPS